MGDRVESIRNSHVYLCVQSPGGVGPVVRGVMIGQSVATSPALLST